MIGYNHARSIAVVIGIIVVEGQLRVLLPKVWCRECRSVSCLQTGGSWIFGGGLDRISQGTDLKSVPVEEGAAEDRNQIFCLVFRYSQFIYGNNLRMEVLINPKISEAGKDAGADALNRSFFNSGSVGQAVI